MYPAVFARTYPFTSAAQVLDAIATDGFEGVQFNLTCLGLDPVPKHLPDGVAEVVTRESTARKLTICALSGTYNMAHPEEAVRLAARPRFANVVTAAKRMGAPLVSLCTGSRDPANMWSAHPDNVTEGAWRDLRRELDFALALASEAGITLAIEPEPGNVVTDARVARRLLDEVRAPNLGIILDAANLLTPETLPRQTAIMSEAVDLLGRDIVLAHAKDISHAGKVVSPTRGAVDLGAFVSLLHQAKYDGALVGHGFEHADTGVAAKALRQLCAGVA